MTSNTVEKHPFQAGYHSNDTSLGNEGGKKISFKGADKRDGCGRLEIILRSFLPMCNGEVAERPKALAC